MYNATVIGVDPGQVHTGVVMLDFDFEHKALAVDHRVVDGLDANMARAAAELMSPRPLSICNIFIEKYRPRSGFTQNQDMMAANQTFSSTLHGKLLQNSGVKKVVTRELLELLHVYAFGTKTHHQDLRSAARIAVLGMLQDDALNNVLYTYCTDTTEGRDWNVRVN